MAKIGPTYNLNDTYVKIPDCQEKMAAMNEYIRSLSTAIEINREMPEVIETLSGGFELSDGINPYALLAENYLYPADYRMITTYDEVEEARRRLHQNGGLDYQDDMDEEMLPEKTITDESEMEEDSIPDATTPVGRYIREVSAIMELELPGLLLGFHGPCKGWTFDYTVPGTPSWISDDGGETITVEIIRSHSLPEWDLMLNFSYYHEFMEEACKNNWEKWDELNIRLSRIWGIPYVVYHPTMDTIIKF